MPISEKRLAANRANALKSTGPKSEIGKRNSSRNGARHEFLAGTFLIDTESRPRLAELANSFHAEFQPATFAEEVQVEKMVAAHWRLMRTWAVESAGIIHETRCQAGSTVNENAPTRAMLAIRAIGENERHPDLHGRHEYRYDRQYYRALECLTRLQESRRARENAEKTKISPREPMQSTETKGPSETPEATKATTKPTAEPTK
jgi:hypothetical protein